MKYVVLNIFTITKIAKCKQILHVIFKTTKKMASKKLFYFFLCCGTSSWGDV